MTGHASCVGECTAHYAFHPCQRGQGHRAGEGSREGLQPNRNGGCHKQGNPAMSDRERIDLEPPDHLCERCGYSKPRLVFDQLSLLLHIVWNVFNGSRPGLSCARMKRRETWIEVTGIFPSSIRPMNPGLRRKRQPSAGLSPANPAASNFPITSSSCSRPMGRMRKRLRDAFEFSRSARTIRLLTGGEKRFA